MARNTVHFFRYHPGTVAVYVVLGIMTAVIVFPFYWLMISGTHTLSGLMGRFPPPLWFGGEFWANLQTILSRVPFFRSYANSLFVATTSTVAQLFFCSLAGYAFAKYAFPGRQPLFFMLLATMMLPSALSFVPWYIMMGKFGWINRFEALIIPGMAPAFGIFWLRQVINQTVPDELLHAAKIDGATDFGTYWRIVLPVILPGLGALGIMTFMGVWNDYMAPLIILSDVKKFTLPLMVASLAGWGGSQVHLQLLGAALATLPMLVVFFLASRQFISGMMAGALKG
jgi:ABC-type glycerol-3-phosphate transport system permease component